MLNITFVLCHFIMLHVILEEYIKNTQVPRRRICFYSAQYNKSMSKKKNYM